MSNLGIIKRHVCCRSVHVQHATCSIIYIQYLTSTISQIHGSLIEQTLCWFITIKVFITENTEDCHKVMWHDPYTEWPRELLCHLHSGSYFAFKYVINIRCTLCAAAFSHRRRTGGLFRALIIEKIKSADIYIVVGAAVERGRFPRLLRLNLPVCKFESTPVCNSLSQKKLIRPTSSLIIMPFDTLSNRGKTWRTFGKFCKLCKGVLKEHVDTSVTNFPWCCCYPYCFWGTRVGIGKSGLNYFFLSVVYSNSQTIMDFSNNDNNGSPG